MNDAPSVPLEPEQLANASAFPWKQRGVSLALLLGGAGLALFAMCARPGLPGGLWLGLFGTCLATAATLRFSERGDLAEPAAVLAGRALLGPVLHGLGALVSLWGALRLAVLGVIPQQVLVLAWVVPAAFLWLVLAVAVGAGRLGFLAEPARPLWRRHGLWLIALSTLLYLPRLGSFGLIDCWETHYGEVAREMLSRDDWISLWWAQDGWFWSKPVLNFWAQGLSFSALGVAWAPDQMIQSVAIGRTPQPEWAARLPMFLMAVVGQHFTYLGMRRYTGRLAAFLGALVLVTSPYWYLLARQSMADMAYVAPLAAAMGCILLALRATPDEQVRTVELRLSPRGPRLRLSGYHLLFAAVLLLVLPQVLYLASRNVTLQWADLPLRLSLHADQVLSGSLGNCELPGNTPCRPDLEASHVPLPPLGAALIWASAAGVLLWLRRGERRAKRLYYLAAWLLAGLSFMGKGAPGLILVLFTFGGFLLARARTDELAHVDALGFGLVLLAVVAPWFVQEYLRHGSDFFERLFIHDMYMRAFDHVHDTNKGDDTSFRYYVWQLGYGLFPWSGLSAAAVLFCIHRTLGARARDGSDPKAAELADLSYLCVLWLLAGFGMFAITGTKYHHYALPLVPPLAMLTGVFLAALLERRSDGQTSALSDGAWAIGAAAVVLLCGRDLAVTRQGDVEGAARLIQLVTYNYGRSWPKTLDYSLPLWLFTGAAALCSLAMLAGRIRRWAAVGACAVSVLACVWAVDCYLIQISPHWGQRETISEYYKRRVGPEEPLVAYQQNWKGENFYTGNNVPAFVSSGKRFTDWVEAQKKSGVQVMFFTTEHSRVGSLQRELGSPQKFELLTDATLNDKFVLARAAF